MNKARTLSSTEKARYETLYTEKIRPELKKSLQLKNVMEVPRLEKIVLNIGVKEAVADSRILNTVLQMFDTIAGQKAVKTIAHKSIAGFKIREGMPIGARVTLRKKRCMTFWISL